MIEKVCGSPEVHLLLAICVSGDLRVTGLCVVTCIVCWHTFWWPNSGLCARIKNQIDMFEDRDLAAIYSSHGSWDRSADLWRTYRAESKWCKRSLTVRWSTPASIAWKKRFDQNYRPAIANLSWDQLRRFFFKIVSSFFSLSWSYVRNASLVFVSNPTQGSAPCRINSSTT